MLRKKRKTPIKKSTLREKRKQQEGLGDIEYSMELFAKDPKKRSYLLMDEDMLDMTAGRQKRYKEANRAGTLELNKKRREKLKEQKRKQKEKDATSPLETKEGKFKEPSRLRKAQLKGSAINRKFDDFFGTATTQIPRKKGGKISEGTKLVARQYGGKIGK
tara:strand:+ start:45 stop:527 length:483 start_codon:yes stop_codon:yes gene_type:complete